MYSQKLNEIGTILPVNPENAVRIIKKHIAEAKQWLAAGVEAKVLLDEIRLAMNKLFDYALANHLLEKLFRYFMKDIKSWLITIKQKTSKKNEYGNIIENESENTILYPFLSECACIVSGIFNRFKNNTRETIESSVMDFVKNHIAKTDRNVIRYLSLGSGELLADFILINQILLLIKDSGGPVTQLEINLIDPIYKNIAKDTLNAVSQFEYLEELAEELGLKFALEAYPSINEYLADDPKNQDVIMATDFDEFHTTAFKSAIKAHKLLEEQGQMFLSFRKERYILTKTQSLSPLRKISYLDHFPLKTKKHFKIASLVERNIYTVYSIILPYIQRLKDCDVVTLTLPHPQKINSEGFWMGANFPDLSISREDVHYFISKFIPNITLVLNFVTGYDNFEMLLPQFSEDQDLVLCFDRKCTQENKALFKDIAAVHNKFTTADVLFDIKAPSPSQPENNFSCLWIFEQEENSTNILRGNDASAKILGDAYQYVVSENLNQVKQPS